MPAVFKILTSSAWLPQPIPATTALPPGKSKFPLLALSPGATGSFTLKPTQAGSCPPHGRMYFPCDPLTPFLHSGKRSSKCVQCLHGKLADALVHASSRLTQSSLYLFLTLINTFQTHFPFRKKNVQRTVSIHLSFRDAELPLLRKEEPPCKPECRTRTDAFYFQRIWMDLLLSMLL